MVNTDSRWQTAYSRKLVSSEVALANIHSGDRVVIGFGYEPQTLVTALVARAGDLQNVEVIAPGVSDRLIWFRPGLEDSFQASAETFGWEQSRQALETRLGDYYPTLFSKALKAYDERPDEAQPIDVFLAPVTPP